VEISLTECNHGIPLVNGKGCIICSNKDREGRIVISLAKGSRVTTEMRRLASLGADKVDEVPVDQFV
jgi:recombinational DNA repair protein RecR